MQLTEILNYWINLICIVKIINYYSRLFFTKTPEAPPDEFGPKFPTSQSCQLSEDNSKNMIISKVIWLSQSQLCLDY